MYAIIAYVITYFGQAETYIWHIKVMNYLPGIVS